MGNVKEKKNCEFFSANVQTRRIPGATRGYSRSSNCSRDFNPAEEVGYSKYPSDNSDVFSEYNYDGIRV